MSTISLMNPSYNSNMQPKDILISKIDEKIKVYIKSQESSESVPETSPIEEKKEMHPMEVTMERVKIARRISEGKKASRNSGEFQIRSRSSSSPRISIGKANEARKDSDLKCSSFSKKAFELV